jgi:two-component system LytT family response regulator
MTKVLIVENEKRIAEHLSTMLLKLYNDIQLLPVCDNVKDALVSIRLHAPDLLFLDIELNNEETGFDILRQFSIPPFDVIFATAFDKYAVQAIKFSALDFLLKPVAEDDLVLAVEKFHRKINAPLHPKQIEILFANLNRGPSMNQVALPTMHGYDFVSVDTIVYCEGEGSQTAVYLSSKDHPVIISKTLKECEDLFSNDSFFRIHKSFFINLNHIKKYTKGKDGEVMMSNSKTLQVSRNYKETFLSKFNRNSN